MMSARLFALVAAGSAFGAYTWYSTDPLTTINPTKWWQNGTIAAGSGGVTSSAAKAAL
jgi:hypothetical protein